MSIAPYAARSDHPDKPVLGPDRHLDPTGGGTLRRPAPNATMVSPATEKTAPMKLRSTPEVVLVARLATTFGRSRRCGCRHMASSPTARSWLLRRLWTPRVGGGHAAVGRADGARTDRLDRPAGQAGPVNERHPDGADVIGDPALVTRASCRVALHRARQADVERLRRELQRPAAGRLPQGDAFHLDGPCLGCTCPLAARRQHNEAALHARWEGLRRDRQPNCPGACRRTHCHQLTQPA